MFSLFVKSDIFLLNVILDKQAKHWTQEEIDQVLLRA